ncbi:hypothetical protein RJ640_021269 [Escallonia rubra]|uniref:Fatty acid desaturase domain-containing protein n=1 Tax=Escallonia rubra TaxID=112253 RepID=A0AA88U8B7_9ASTE|nr:hypothetical protein RJ640_021269 [Escallonia rubra]
MAQIAPPHNAKPFSLPAIRQRPERTMVPFRPPQMKLLSHYAVSGQLTRVGHIKRVSLSVVRATSISASEGGRIMLSDVVVTRPRNVYWGRKWNLMDVATAGVVVVTHLMCLVAPFVFNWGAFWVTVGLYVATGLLGITMTFHRYLSHRSFKLPKWLEYLFAYFGAQALQGSPIDWVSTHRYHHQHCDSEKDPHSPIEGFWFSHMSWIFDTKGVINRCGEMNNVGDLEKQPFYRFLHDTYIIHPIALGVLLYALGGFPYIVWGMVDMTWYVVRLLQAVGLATDVKVPSEAQKQRMAFSVNNE